MSKHKCSDMQEAVFKLIPWNWDVVALTGGCPNKLCELVMQLGMPIDDVSDGSTGHTFIYEGKPIIMWVQSLRQLDVLVHEIIHAVFGALDARGLKHCVESEEAYTYTVSELFRQVRACKKWRRV